MLAEVVAPDIPVEVVVSSQNLKFKFIVQSNLLLINSIIEFYLNDKPYH